MYKSKRINQTKTKNLQQYIIFKLINHPSDAALTNWSLPAWSNIICTIYYCALKFADWKKVDISWGFLYANNHHRHNKYFQNIINSIIFLQFVFGATRWLIVALLCLHFLPVQKFNDWLGNIFDFILNIKTFLIFANKTFDWVVNVFLKLNILFIK